MHKKNLFPIVGNQLTQLLFGLVGVKVLSHLVPPDTNGVYQVYFLTLSQVGVLLTHSGLMNHASRYWRREQICAGSYARFLWTNIWKGTRYLLPILFFISMGLLWSKREPVWLWMSPLLFICNVLLVINGTVVLALNTQERHWSVLGLNFVGGVTRVFFPACLVILLSPTLVSMGVGFTLHSITVVVVSLGILVWALHSPVAEPQREQKWLQELRSYGRPFVWIGVGGWLLQFADRWVVSLFFGDRQAGIFTVAAGLGGYVPILLSGSLMQWVFPSVFREADSARTVDDWRRLVRHCDLITALYSFLSVIGLVGLSVIGPHLIGWLVDVRYARSVSMVLPAGLSMLTVQVNQFQYLLLQGQHNSRAMVKVMLNVATIKTLGGGAAAALSWDAFLLWLLLSPLLAASIGRWMIHRELFRSLAIAIPPDHTAK